MRPVHVVLALAGVLALLLTACSSDTAGTGNTASPTGKSGSATSGSASSAGSSSASSTPTKPAKPAIAVHMKLLNGDGYTYGVGMPIIAYFSKKITSGKALQTATTVTINGKAAHGAWYFEYSSANKGYPIEGHFRPENYWPAHSKIHIGMPVKGLSAGKGMAFDDSLTLDFSTGARTISTVDNSTHTISVTSDGKHYGTFPVSLGASKTPTFSGTKVIMEQVPTVCMHDTNNTYYECGIKWDQRLTYSGEYLHAAPWNASNIAHGINSSNGCTNLNPAVAERLYKFMHVGDVVDYPNADGGRMQLGQGYGDWNLDWSQWQTGGLVPTQS